MNPDIQILTAEELAAFLRPDDLAKLADHCAEELSETSPKRWCCLIIGDRDWQLYDICEARLRPKRYGSWHHWCRVADLRAVSALMR